MEFLNYHIESGHVASVITIERVDMLPDPQPGYAYVEGAESPDQYWVNGELLQTREPLVGEVLGMTVLQGEQPIPVMEFPNEVWCFVRGSKRNGFYHEMIKATNGVLTFSPDLVGKYYVRVIGQYIAPEFSFEVVTLDSHKEYMHRQVDLQKEQRIAQGFVHEGRRYQADQKAQNNMNGAMSASGNGALPNGFFWTDYDNNDVPMNPAKLLNLGKAMMNFSFACHGTARALKGAIDDATDLASIQAIDVTQGWPS